MNYQKLIVVGNATSDLEYNLSEAKPGTYDRDTEHQFMADAFRFLTELLNAIDPTKLKN